MDNDTRIQFSRFGATVLDRGRESLLDALASREWWIVPIVGEGAYLFAREVERRYYAAAADGGFRVVIGNMGGVAAVVLAAKRFMSPRQAAALVVKFSGSENKDDLARAFESRDILAVIDQDDEAACDQATLAFGTWLTGTPPPQRVLDEMKYLFTSPDR